MQEPSGPIAAYGGALLKLNVVSEGGRSPEKVTARLVAGDGASVLTFENPDKIVAQPGNYRLIVAAPGYKAVAREVTLTPSEATTVTVQLFKVTFFDGVWQGFKYTILPYRTPNEPTWKLTK